MDSLENEVMANTSAPTEDYLASILALLNDQDARNLLPVVITLVVLMVIGTVGNGLVVQVYWCRMRRSAKRTFILTLALIDLAVCMVVIPFELYDLKNQVLFDNDTICKVMRLLEYCTVLSGGFVLVSISFERYYFLCRAFQEFSPKKAKIVCVTCFSFALLLSTPSVHFAGAKIRNMEHEGLNVTGCECSMNSEKHKDDPLKKIYYYVLATVFFSCFIIFLVLYSMIGRLLWQYQKGVLLPSSSGVLKPNPMLNSTADLKKVSVDQSSGQSHASSTSKDHVVIHGRRRIKSAGTIMVFFSVTVVFVISFLPHLAIRIIMLFGKPDGESFDLIYNFTVRSYLLSNVSNPFIYSILNQSFRKELKRTLKCIRCQKPENDSSLLALNARRRYV